MHVFEIWCYILNSMSKPEINIVYVPHKAPPVIHYDGPEGRVWMSKTWHPKIPNVYMSWYSVRKTHPEDSLYVIEPRCVHDKDYSPDFANKFKHIFTWANKGFQDKQCLNKLIEVNHPSCKGGPSIENLKANHTSWENRANEIIFIANNKSSNHNSELYSLRIQLADQLSKHFKVKWYGQMSLKKPYYCGKIDNKLHVLRKARFTVCTENCYDPVWSHNYLTEKLPHAWFSGAVPLYMGCYNIDDFNFPNESYIDLRKFVTKNRKEHKINMPELIDRIKSFDKAKFDQLNAAKFENMEKPDGLLHVISSDRVHKKMLETLHPNKDDKVSVT